MTQFYDLVIYRETKLDTLPIDELPLVRGLMGLGMVPIKAETNGKKLRIHFEKSEEFSRNYQLLQRALAGALPAGEPLLIDYLKTVQADQMWRDLLSNMNSTRTN